MLHNALNHSASACSTWGCTLSMKYVNNFSTAPVVDTRFSEPFDLFCLQVVPKKQQLPLSRAEVLVLPMLWFCFFPLLEQEAHIFPRTPSRQTFHILMLIILPIERVSS